MKRRGALVAILFLAASVTSGQARAEGARHNPPCGATPDHNVKLVEDLRCNSAMFPAALHAQFNGQKFDLGEYSIINTNSMKTGIGIEVSQLDGVQIVGGAVNGFAIGIQFSNVGDATVKKVSANSNGTGLRVDDGVHVVVKQSTFSSNDDLGAELSDNVVVEVKGSRFANNNNGLATGGNQLTVLKGNVVDENNVIGITSVDDELDASVNIVTKNQTLGFYVNSDATMTKNIAYLNSGHGMFFVDCDCARTLEVKGNILVQNALGIIVNDDVNQNLTDSGKNLAYEDDCVPGYVCQTVTDPKFLEKVVGKVEKKT